MEFVFQFYITNKIDKNPFLCTIGKKIDEEEYEIDRNSPLLKIYFEKILSYFRIEYDRLDIVLIKDSL